MKLEITKSDFERAVPAAREPKGRIFDVMQDAVSMRLDIIGRELLGDPGTAAVEEGTGSTADSLRLAVRHLACVGAFLNEMRGLDLVLTATGFGVVSTQDTAPASKMRVDSLEGELRRKERLLVSQLVGTLFGVSGWSKTEQRRQNVGTLFWSFTYLQQYAAISNPMPSDWDGNVPAMLAADHHLRKHIGWSYMEELLSALTSNSLSAPDRVVVTACQRITGAWIARNRALVEELLMRLVNTMEADLSQYPSYADSEAFRLNHFKPYENHAEDSAFHFVG